MEPFKDQLKFVKNSGSYLKPFQRCMHLAIMGTLERMSRQPMGELDEYSLELGRSFWTAAPMVVNPRRV